MLNIDDIVKLSLYLNSPAVSANTFYAGLIIGSSNVISTADRVKAFKSVADMVKGGFSNDSPEVKAATLYFAQQPAPELVYIGVKGAEETPQKAVEACLEASGDFWGVSFAVAMTAQQILDVDATLTEQNRGMQFAAFSDPASAIAAAGPLDTLKDRRSNRTIFFVTDDSDNVFQSAAALMGRVLGLNGYNKNGAFSIAFKDLFGIETSGLGKSVVDDVKAKNGTVYITRGYNYNLVESGATGSGLRVDEVLYLDMMFNEMQNGIMELFQANNVRLGQVDSTSARFINVLCGVLNNWAARGVIAEGEWKGNAIGNLERGDIVQNGYYMFCDSYIHQSQADREARKAMPIKIALVMAGSVENVELSVYAQR